MYYYLTSVYEVLMPKFKRLDNVWIRFFVLQCFVKVVATDELTWVRILDATIAIIRALGSFFWWGGDLVKMPAKMLAVDGKFKKDSG